MPIFAYKARNAKGQLISGTMTVNSQDSVASQLSNAGVTPVDIKEVVEETSSAGGMDIRELEWFKPKITVEDLIMFSRQMFSLMKAGVPISRAMRGLSETVRNDTFKEVLNSVEKSLESGVTLATSMQQHPKVFTNLMVSMVHVGENTGRLDEAFYQISAYLELDRTTTRQIKAATRYPKIVMGAMAGAITMMNMMVIPTFANFFKKQSMELPWQTKVLIGMSDFFLNYWYLILMVVVGSFIAFKRYLATEEGLYNWDRRKLKFPIMGGIFERIALGRFSRAFSMMLRSGVPLVQALSIVSRVVTNEFIGRHIREMRTNVERGDSFSNTIVSSGMFSPLVIQMVAVGDETGSMDKMLEEVAEFYEEEVAYDLKKLGDAIEPILIVFMGILVLILALGIFLPMWDLTALTRK